MKKDTTLKIVGFACTAIAFAVSVVQKKLDDQKLESIVSEEVQRQIENLK